MGVYFYEVEFFVVFVKDEFDCVSVDVVDCWCSFVSFVLKVVMGYII